MVAGQNTILFLFNENDLLASGKQGPVSFIFGDPDTTPETPCVIPSRISESNQVKFNCGCNYIDYETNIITIDCTIPNNDIIFTNIRSYFGYSSNTHFLIDFPNNKSHFGFSSNTSTIIAADMRLVSTGYFGLDSNSFLTIERRLEASSHFGHTSTTGIVYDPYNELFDPGEYTQAVFGYELKNVFVFNPYNEFFAPGEFAQSSFGYELKNVFVFNPYNEFFNTGAYAGFYFGYENKASVQFNPYNPFITDVIGSFGYSVSSGFRYSDNPYISDDPINFDVGFESAVSVKYADTRASFLATSYNGVSSDVSVQISPGFIGRSYLGYSSKLRYIAVGIPYATFSSCVASFGFEMMDNGSRPRFFDISRTECCTITTNELHHIEMNDYDDWDVMYGLHVGWGLSSISDLCTQPRFASTSVFGLESKVVDNSVYLDHIEMSFGITAHTRSLQYSSNIEIGYGNFITDKNEIKIELTKPLDTFDSNYLFTFGASMFTNFGCSYSLGTTYHRFGLSLISDLFVEEALRPIARFGFYSESVLNREVKFFPSFTFGYESKTVFYEAPYMMHFGFESYCESLVVENFVEFLEDGELENEYIYQNENGDRDMDKPYKVTIEGHEFTHYVRGRCY